MLTLPDGSSRSAKPEATQEDIATKTAGGCMVTLLGERVTVITEGRNTSVVTLGSGGDSRTHIVPNMDFQFERTVRAQPSGEIDLHTEISTHCPKLNCDSRDFQAVPVTKSPCTKPCLYLPQKQQHALDLDLKEHCGEAGLACPYCISIGAFGIM